MQMLPSPHMYVCELSEVSDMQKIHILHMPVYWHALQLNLIAMSPYKNVPQTRCEDSELQTPMT